MNEQYWDCDDCQERYPYGGTRYKPCTNRTGNAMLCNDCYTKRQKADIFSDLHAFVEDRDKKEIG